MESLTIHLSKISVEKLMIQTASSGQVATVEQDSSFKSFELRADPNTSNLKIISSYSETSNKMIDLKNNERIWNFHSASKFRIFRSFPSQGFMAALGKQTKNEPCFLLVC